MTNAKLIHMLTGAKIAKRILEEAGYDKEKSKAITGIIAVHDADQVPELGFALYDTHDKKVFHDYDRLGAFEPDRLRIYIEKFVTKEKLGKLRKELLGFIDGMFFPAFKEEAERRRAPIEALIDEKEAGA